MNPSLPRFVFTLPLRSLLPSSLAFILRPSPIPLTHANILLVRKRRLEMYEKPDSILDIYAEAYGYEKLGITDTQLLQQKQREKKEAEEKEKVDWFTATTDGM